MNKISDKEIMSYLKEQTDILIKEYGHQIIGTFVIGNANYGFADSIDEVYITALYVPKFDELCFGVPFHKYNKETRVVIDDVRHYYTAEMDIWKDYLELLFSNYFIIMDEYKDAFNILLNNKELIGHAKPKERIQCAAERAMGCYENNPLEAYRLLLAASEYEQGKDLDYCFHLDKNPAYNKFLWETKKDGIYDIELFKTSCAGLYDRAKGEPNLKAIHLIKEGVIALIEASLHTHSSTDTFCSAITSTEKKALKAIIEEINIEGNISVSKIVEKTKISRPVYTNLFTKMTNYKVAKVTSQGVKGMHIKILDRRLLEI